MATIDSKAIITELLRADGRLGDDPQALLILTYINDWGKRTAAVCYFPEEVAGYCVSPHIHNPEILWTRGTGLTIIGQAWIDAWMEESK